MNRMQIDYTLSELDRDMSVVWDTQGNSLSMNGLDLSDLYRQIGLIMHIVYLVKK